MKTYSNGKILSIMKTTYIVENQRLELFFFEYKVKKIFSKHRKKEEKSV